MPITQQQKCDDSPEKTFRVFWGGPDRASRFLRDVLEARIHAVPTGGEIVWVTYYFRDEGLAQALIKARRRGVKVRVLMEGNPRTKAVNTQVRKILGHKDALGKNLRVLSHRMVDNRWLRRCRLHEKLYYFSHPVPSTLVGTFNPSGNHQENPAITRKIGDQDRGHNVLVEVTDPILVEGLHGHAHRLFRITHGPWERFLPESNRIVVSGESRILFFPRSRKNDFTLLFNDLGPNCSLRMAVSHLNDPGICKNLFALASRGVHIEILAHDTKRRVPYWVEKKMLENQIIFNRYVHPEGLPMHNKFILLETPERQAVILGSLNLSVRSLHVNHELLLYAACQKVFADFRRRWDSMLTEMKGK